MTNRDSYRQILKATSIFGGVQVFNILIAIIKSKFIAVFLGPSGMGIVGLFSSTIEFISGLTNLGLGVSAVRDISAANETKNEIRIASIVISFKRIIWVTGILGAILTLIFSSWLSEVTFGNKNNTIAFVWLSISLLFSQLTIGQLVVLQGMRKIQFLAKANITGNVLSLIISVPLYYYYRLDAIVFVLIISSIFSFLVSSFYVHKIKIKKIKVKKIRTLAQSKNMIKMGLIISLSGLMSVGSSYIVKIFINKFGGAAEVGLFNAGFAIINTYVGLIFTAIATDFYPRLSAVASNNKQCRQIINQQAEIAILLLAPIILVFLTFINWVIILLYSYQFIAINEMIYWVAIGMLFKAVSWSISFIFLSKGAGKIAFWNEFAANIYILAFNLIGYKYWGLEGIGFSFLISYIFYLLQVFFISKIKYKFGFIPEFYKIFIIQLFLVIGCFIIIKFIGNPYSYFIGSGIIIISSWYSFNELDKRLGLKGVIISLKNKFF